MNRNEFFQALPITKLALRLTSAALEICTDDIDDIHVMVSGSKADVEALRVSAAADALSVEQPVSALAKTASADSSWLQIAIRLPRSWKGAIEARTVSGWINIRSISGTDLSLDTVSGTVMGTELGFITLMARAVTGDVKLSQVVSDKITLFSTSGGLTLSDAQVRTASASTVTGGVTLGLSAPFEELTLASVTGDLCVDAPVLLCDAVLRSVSGRIRTDGVSIAEGGAKIRATTVSSDLDVTSTVE